MVSTSTLSFVLVLALATSVAARPSTSGEFGGVNDQNPYKLLDDMRFVDAQLEQTKAGGVRRSEYLWTGRQVPYVIDPSVGKHALVLIPDDNHSKRMTHFFEPLTAHVANDIKRAMMEYQNNSCIRFVPYTNHTNYIKIFAGDGCYSYAGMINQGQQPVSIGKGCEPYGTILHEFGHAIGLYHEQNRDDRDDHVIIYWDNIAQGMQSQFDKLAAHEVDHVGTPYDFDSIMHYGSTAFSRDWISYTMVKKNGEPLTEVRKKSGLSEYDFIAINSLYGC